MMNTHKQRTRELGCLNLKTNCSKITLMFGWFENMGWLALFMKKMPIFPIPGNGNFIRQPLFVKDFVK